MSAPTLVAEIDSDVRGLRVPYHVLLELTYGCNLRCVMCYNPTHSAVGELTTDEYVDLFDQLVEVGTLQLTFTGGEILARADLWELAAEARRRHFALRLFTNGVRVTPPIAARFAALAPLAVEVSLYGATAATHDAHTAKPGSFERTLAGIDNLVAAGAPVVLKTLLTRWNAHEVDAICDLVAGRDVRFKGFDPVVFSTHSGDASPVELRVPTEEVARLLPGDLLDDEDPFTGDDQPMCGAAQDFASITPHGLVYPCLSMRLPMGSIREDRFADIWFRPHDDVDRVRSATFGGLPVCGTCDMRAGCQRCPGLAHHEDGDVLGPSSTHCGLTTARVELRARGDRTPITEEALR